MPFIFIGIAIVVISAFFLRKAIKSKDREGIIGVTAMLIAGIILLLFFGVFYNILLP
tara:strand:+ start:65 stop:235 length:171 start_codon:yes stop_codon:yes gene_type:complete